MTSVAPVGDPTFAELYCRTISLRMVSDAEKVANCLHLAIGLGFMAVFVSATAVPMILSEIDELHRWLDVEAQQFSIDSNRAWQRIQQVGTNSRRRQRRQIASGAAPAFSPEQQNLASLLSAFGRRSVPPSQSYAPFTVGRLGYGSTNPGYGYGPPSYGSGSIPTPTPSTLPPTTTKRPAPVCGRSAAS